MPATLAAPAWTPTITLTQNGRPAAARLRLTIRKGAVARMFDVRTVRKGSYRVRVVFPAEGRWSWTLTGSRTLARGAITVTTLFPFELPYDLAVAQDGTILFLDRGRVLVWNPATRRVRVHATTSSEELVALVRHADGTLYAADLPGNRILRVDPAGRAAKLADLRAPGDLVLHPDGMTLWAVSLEDGVHRIDVATGGIEQIAEAENSHGIDRDAAGNRTSRTGASSGGSRPTELGRWSPRSTRSSPWSPPTGSTASSAHRRAAAPSGSRPTAAS